MAEPMSDARLAEIRAEVTGACSCCGYDKHDFDASYALELLAEVDRLHALPPVLVLPADAEISDEDVQRWKAAYAEMQGYATPITFATGEDGNPQPQWPTHPSTEHRD